MLVEVWRTAIYDGEVYDNYEVSNMGNVRSVKTGRILKGVKTRHNYLQVGLHKDGKCKRCYVHRLVLTTFNPTDDATLTDCNHINENKHDNRLENLEWMTHKQNVNHGTRNERDSKTKSKKIIGKSLNENKVIILRSATQAKKFGFHQGHINECCRGKQKSHKGYTWSYID